MLAADTLRYSLSDAERWAAFSGDYNPIHFDAARAQRLGLTGLCVHGMRAMLDMKSALSTSREKHGVRAEGLMFTSRLREPVLCDTLYQLPVCETLRDDGVQLSASLRHVQTQQASISSKLIATDVLVLPPVTQMNTLGAQELATLHTQFLAVGSPVVPAWSFLDAVLFRQLVNAPQTLETVHSLLPSVQANSLGDIFTLVQVVQTHHETHFPPRLLTQTEQGQRFGAIHYAIRPTLVMGEKQRGMVLLAGIQAWQDGEPLMSVAVTLKTGPLTE
jgi:hypothetical protein